MKLRNKKTGEIMQLSVKCENGGELRTFDLNTNTDEPITLAELNEGWEDVPEEPKDYWWISPVDTDVVHCVEDVKDEMDQYNKEIGNYFETREEAEKVVSLLKRIAIIKSYGCNVYKHINNTVLQIEDYYERNKDGKRIRR